MYEVGSGDILLSYLEGVPSGFTSDNLYYISTERVYKVGTWDIVCEFGGNIISADGKYFVRNERYNKSGIFEIGSWSQIQYIGNRINNFSEKWIFSFINQTTLHKLDKSNLDLYKLYKGLINLNYKKMANFLATSYNKVELNYNRKLALIDNKKNMIYQVLPSLKWMNLKQRMSIALE
ncbi:hypothetical protein MHK_000452 [Candidatus Magnetomorum sp. HK-1]|nr:hypothetical protein MHK_000452 [Candidatus Magnetomorum sp. HK-1]